MLGLGSNGTLVKSQPMPLASIEEALEEIRAGRMVILINEEAPDSDGFFFLPAEKVTAENVNYMLSHGRGIVYVTLTDERIRELGILLVPEENSKLRGLLCGASFTVRLEGVHGVSAQGRAHTIQAAIAEQTRHEDIVVPGHVQPLQARSGGVLARSGRSEASVIWRAWRVTNPPALFARFSKTTAPSRFCPRWSVSSSGKDTKLSPWLA